MERIWQLVKGGQRVVNGAHCADPVGLWGRVRLDGDVGGAWLAAGCLSLQVLQPLLERPLLDLPLGPEVLDRLPPLRILCPQQGPPTLRLRIVDLLPGLQLQCQKVLAGVSRDWHGLLRRCSRRHGFSLQLCLQPCDLLLLPSLLRLNLGLLNSHLAQRLFLLLAELLQAIVLLLVPLGRDRAACFQHAIGTRLAPHLLHHLVSLMTLTLDLFTVAADFFPLPADLLALPVVHLFEVTFCLAVLCLHLFHQLLELYDLLPFFLPPQADDGTRAGSSSHSNSVHLHPLFLKLLFKLGDLGVPSENVDLLQLGDLCILLKKLHLYVIELFLEILGFLCCTDLLLVE
mmetsp:Transcript_121749/g.211443  ORF Transcript_121749/g.211443 Transcript_121749/m.211443 type:complete len:344 (+) Transcript_121749:1805-2836(+)